MRFTTYDLATGRIKDRWEVPDEETALLNVDPATEGMIEGHVDGAIYYRRPDGTLAEYPPQPTPAHVWDFAAEAWIDPRTPEDIAAEEAAALAAERAAMVASRFQAKAALLQAGLLDAAEAAVAQSDSLTRLAWIEAVEYRRNSPAILAIAAALGLTDAQVDDLFRAAMQIAV